MQYPNFPKECQSLLCKYLSPEVFEELKDKKTAFSFTLEQAINSGVKNIDSGIGVYAGDEESYELFSSLFNPIIQDYHGFTKEDRHKSNLNPDYLKWLQILMTDAKYILSTTNKSWYETVADYSTRNCNYSRCSKK